MFKNIEDFPCYVEIKLDVYWKILLMQMATPLVTICVIIAIYNFVGETFASIDW